MQYCTAEQICEFLGISRATLWRWENGCDDFRISFERTLKTSDCFVMKVGVGPNKPAIEPQLSVRRRRCHFPFVNVYVVVIHASPQYVQSQQYPKC